VGNSFGSIGSEEGKGKSDGLVFRGRGRRVFFKDRSWWDFRRSSSAGRLSRRHIRGKMGWFEAVNGYSVSTGSNLEVKGMRMPL
jgi:hypothetical protein